MRRREGKVRNSRAHLPCASLVDYKWGNKTGNAWGKFSPIYIVIIWQTMVWGSSTVSFESLSFDQRRLRIFLLEYHIFHSEKILCSWNNCWSHCLAVSHLHFNLYFLISLLNNTFFSLLFVWKRLGLWKQKAKQHPPWHFHAGHPSL